MTRPRFNRILLKLSGEALMGKEQFGIDADAVDALAREVLAARQHCPQLCLVVGGGKSLGTQPVDRSLHFAAGLSQRLLAVHHAGAGALAKFLHGGGGDLSHVYSFRSPPACGRGRGWVCQWRWGGHAHPSIPSRSREGKIRQASSATSAGGSAMAPTSSPFDWASPVRPALTAEAIESQ